MKIEICGYAGSGKSTLAKELSKIYNIEVLHIDKLHFKSNFVERKREDLDKDIREFLNTHSEWVIDGSYFNRAPERFFLADYIIIMNFNRFSATRRILKRIKKYKGTQRDDIADGCLERFSFSFIMWSLFGGRSHKRNKQLKNIAKLYKEKIIYLKNQKQIDNFLRRIENGGPIKES